MAELTVGITYGSSLYDVAKELGKEEPILEELEQLSEIFKKNPDFLEFVSTPVISKHEKKEELKAIFEGKLIPEVLNFVYILVDKGRAGNFADIVRQYKHRMDIDDKISVGEIFSTVILSPEQLAAFEKETGELLRQTVELTNKLDASLIGGVKIFIEGKVIDASVKSRLQGMKETLGAAVI